MESSLQRLINNLRTLSKKSNIRDFLVFNEEEENLWLSSEKIKESNDQNLIKVYDEIIYDLDEWLISDNGGHHYPNREILVHHGFKFRPGERDAFGPLSELLVVPIANASNNEDDYEIEDNEFIILYG